MIIIASSFWKIDIIIDNVIHIYIYIYIYICIYRKIDNNVIQVEGEIYWEAKSIL